MTALVLLYPDHSTLLPVGTDPDLGALFAVTLFVNRLVASGRIDESGGGDLDAVLALADDPSVPDHERVVAATLARDAVLHRASMLATAACLARFARENALPDGRPNPTWAAMADLLERHGAQGEDSDLEAVAFNHLWPDHDPWKAPGEDRHLTAAERPGLRFLDDGPLAEVLARVGAGLLPTPARLHAPGASALRVLHERLIAADGPDAALDDNLAAAFEADPQPFTRSISAVVDLIEEKGWRWRGGTDEDGLPFGEVLPPPDGEEEALFSWENRCATVALSLCASLVEAALAEAAVRDGEERP